MAHSEWWEAWSPKNVTLADESPDQAWKVCVLHGVYFGESEYNGKLGLRISAVFVIFVTSLIAILTPLLARKYNVPEVYYMIAKMFGSGVIVATAFIHLMDPAYFAIGPNSCVGMTGYWSSYSWCAAFILCGAILTFLVDIYCGALVTKRYDRSPSNSMIAARQAGGKLADQEIVHDLQVGAGDSAVCTTETSDKKNLERVCSRYVADGNGVEFISQFYAFLILECGILLHSVMIGLSLGTTANIDALYAAITFHQAFEGLGIGARLSSIPFPSRIQWVPYTLCVVYALTTPVAIAAGIGVRSTYRENGYTSLVVSGTLDSFAAGVLIYTGFVELIARDFIFTEAKVPLWELNLQVGTFLVGAATMAVIGKWA